jgi:hypothetical protein
MWMLGALIIPVGIGFSVRDVMKKSSIELGGECSDSDHCKSHTCLTGEIGACTKTCNQLDPCPAEFSCERVSVTLQNQAGFHDLGTQGYCLRAKAGSSTASTAAAPSAAPAASATQAPAAPSAVPTASASAAPAASPAPKGKATKPVKPKPKK